MDERMGVLLYREEFFSEVAAILLDHHSSHFPLAKQAFTANARSLDPQRAPAPYELLVLRDTLWSEPMRYIF